MFNKLRQNFKLSKVLICIAFVLAYGFYGWQNGMVAVRTVNELMSGMFYFNDATKVVIAVLSVLIWGVALMFLMGLFAQLFLQMSRFYNVPRAEYALFAQLFCTVYYLICGALRMLNLVTPLLLVWGETLFSFTVSLGCFIAFYGVTSRLYFNDVTRPYYFRNMAIVYFVYALVFEVLL